MGNAVLMDAIRAVATPQASPDVPTVHEIVACWAAGEACEDVPGWLQLCRMVSPDPTAEWLYIFSVVGPHGIWRGRMLLNLQDWCAGMAAEAAFTGRRFRKERLTGYQRRWGRQAGRDGAALAMWGQDVREILPGVNKRAEQYGCKESTYRMIRDYVELEAANLISDFRADMEQAAAGRFDGWFRARYAEKFGREMPKL
jgi:hypothetical protein